MALSKLSHASSSVPTTSYKSSTRSCTTVKSTRSWMNRKTTVCPVTNDDSKPPTYYSKACSPFEHSPFTGVPCGVCR